MDAFLNTTTTFDGLQLHDVLLESLRRRGLVHPTHIQAEFIPRALRGSDLLAQARTGSGKTLAYALPLLHNVLSTPGPSGLRAVVLAPSKELCHQTEGVITGLLGRDATVSTLDVSTEESYTIQRARIRTPSIVIATPASLLQYLHKTGVSLAALDICVMDEVDCMFAFGFRGDCKQLAHVIPQSAKRWMLSATINDAVEHLKRTLLRTPVVIRMEDAQDFRVEEFYRVAPTPFDRAWALLVLIKTNPKAKLLVFVNSIPQCLRVKLLLDYFSVPAVVLNSEVPRDVRLQYIKQFNKNDFPVLIATDETTIEEPTEDAEDAGFNVARGIDFYDVAWVVNYDEPVSDVSYVHRIGRTGRAQKTGRALSFVAAESDTATGALAGRPLQPLQLPERELMLLKTRVANIFQRISPNACAVGRRKLARHERGNSAALRKNLETVQLKQPALVRAERGLMHVPDYRQLPEAPAPGEGMQREKRPRRPAGRPGKAAGPSLVTKLKRKMR